MKNDLKEIYGLSSAGDSVFAAKARFLQSWYRAEILKQQDYGFGPDANSKNRYGNILVNGEQTGSNFLTKEIYNYANYRTQLMKAGETIQQYRLFNNMLSSQPMCFNLFFPLKALFEKDHIAANKIFKACFPSLNIENILAVEIEYLPYPNTEYLDDRTAFDAMILYKTKTGERNILAIETKYVEKLGVLPSSELKKQTELVNESMIFNEIGKEKAKKGFAQLGRNFLLAEKYRIVNRLDNAFAVVISPEENDSSSKEIDGFQSLMNIDFQNRLFYISLESMTSQIKENAPKSLIPWIEDFSTRYLGFDHCESLYKAYKKS